MTNRPASPRDWRLRDWLLLPVVLLILVVVLVVFVPALLVMVPVRWANGRLLRRRWERTWGSRGKRILLVYSRSPHWEEYIERTWLPRLAPHAVIVNWSDRSIWPTWAPLEVRAFRYWGGDTEFNPLALLFPPCGGQVRAIRFWRAFRDVKHGKDAALRQAEAELFEFADALRAR